MNATVVDAVVAQSKLSVWPRYPTVYEINTWVWLSELSQKYAEAVERDGNEMLSPGLYVELAPWKYHLFQCLRPSTT
jgi:hypothetical protein